MKKFLSPIRQSGKALLLSGLLLAVAPVASQACALTGNYTINAGAPASATNYISFTAAVSALSSCGVTGPVTFTVAPGTYTEQVIIPNITGTSAVNTVTFDGVSAASRKITFNQTVSDNRYVIRLNGAKHITIKNLEIHAGTGTFNWGLHLIGNAEHISILGNDIVVPMPASLNLPGVIQSGIIISGSNINNTTQGNNANHVLIENNRILGSSAGISVIGGNTTYLNGIKIKNNLIDGPMNFGVSMTFVNAPEVTGNTILGLATNFPSGGGSRFSGLIFNNIQQGFLVANNRFGNLVQRGMQFANVNAANAAPAYLINNIVTGVISSTYNPLVLINLNTHQIKVWHNSIHIDRGWPQALAVNSMATGIDIRNNSFSNTFDPGKYPLLVIENDESITHLDYNNYYSDGPKLIRINGSDYSSLADVRNAFLAQGFEQNSHYGNPLFSDLKQLIPAGPQLYAKGTSLPMVNSDYFGTARNNPPSIGAIEVQANANDAGVMNILSPQANDQGKAGLQVRFMVTNYGSTTHATIPVQVQISGDINATVSGVAMGPLAWGESAEAVLSFDASAGGNVTIQATTLLPADAVSANDSRSVSVYLHPAPVAPLAADVVACPGTDASVSASGFTNFRWFGQGSGGNVLSTDNPYEFTPAAAIQSVYAEGYNQFADSLMLLRPSIVSCSGTGFEVKAGDAHDLVLKSIVVYNNLFSFGNPALNVYNIYGAPMDYVSTTQPDFTLLHTSTITPEMVGMRYQINFSTPIHIPAGSAYSFFMQGPHRIIGTADPISDSYISITQYESYCAGNAPHLLQGGLIYEATSVTPSPRAETVVRVPYVNAGTDAAVFPGYAPAACTTLEASGMFVNEPGTTISWSHGALGETAMVCPTASTTYTVTVTDAYGCTYSDQVDVCATNVACSNGKVELCKPSGNSGKTQTLCVAPAAVPAHLANGATLGACGTGCGTTARVAATSASKLEVYPNPASGNAYINFTPDASGLVSIEAYDLTGRLAKVLVQQTSEAGFEQTVSFSTDGMPQGTYLIRCTTEASATHATLVVN